ncbi:ATP-binding protein [Verminephrobacter eiseniae]|uniref:ATP-binding protein n=1 Tax=Verminephrobacter eiseniae TaxID=364317 RepID=UPI0022386B80|nr:ATP-binding protein [Verminephrobacter eiseniae]MCW5235660.1 hypothetical protein [Verminephrobacter eiseniae]
MNPPVDIERIAIIGCYGNGKSTLAKALSERTGLPVVHASPMQYGEGTQKVTLENCSLGQLFELTLRRHTERLHAETSANGSYISDGSLMHEWVYLLTRLEHERFPTPETMGQGVNGTALELAQSMVDVSFNYARNTYSKIVLLPNEVPLRDASPPISEHFRQLLNAGFKTHLDARDIPYVETWGTVGARVRKVLDWQPPRRT